jgi:hypothetical protein
MGALELAGAKNIFERIPVVVIQYGGSTIIVSKLKDNGRKHGRDVEQRVGVCICTGFEVGKKAL